MRVNTAGYDMKNANRLKHQGHERDSQLGERLVSNWTLIYKFNMKAERLNTTHQNISMDGLV